MLANARKYAATASSTGASRKATSQEGLQKANNAQQVGSYTTAVGGVTTATGLLMQLSPTPATIAAGKTVEIVGIGTTATGGATTGVAQIAQGKTAEGITHASDGLGKIATSANQ